MKLSSLLQKFTQQLVSADGKIQLYDVFELPVLEQGEITDKLAFLQKFETAFS